MRQFALFIAALFIVACDPVVNSRCILDGATVFGSVERGIECSATFNGSGELTGLVDLEQEGLRLFFSDGCPIGVRRMLRVSPEWSDVFTQRESDISGDLLFPPTTGTGLRFDLSVSTPPSIQCRTTVYVTVVPSLTGTGLSTL